MTETIKPKIFTRYDRPKCAGLTFTLPSETQQNFKDECDINILMNRIIHSGDTSLLTPTERGQYMDTTLFGDFQRSMDLQTHVRADFNSLPSHIRAMFSNDLATYVEWMINPQNAHEAAELGLISLAETLESVIPESGAGQPPAGAFAPKTTSSDGDVQGV